MFKSGKVLSLSLLFAITIFLSILYFQFLEYNKLSRDESNLKKEILKLETQKKSIEEQKKIRNSDEFIEGVAREQLQMIKSNEMIIINEE